LYPWLTGFVLKTTTASIAPAIGAITGTQLYAQSLLRLFFMGNRKCKILGPKSLAGLIA
jgi:hypothetical protein